MAPLPLPLHRAVNLKNRSIGTPLPQPPQRRPAAEVMQFTRLATADRARARNRDSSQVRAVYMRVVPDGCAPLDSWLSSSAGTCNGIGDHRADDGRPSRFVARRFVQTAEAMAADNAALASELRERHRIATAQRLGTAGSMGMAAPGGTPGGDQANSMVLNLDNPEESTLEVLRMELAKLDEDDEDAKSEVGTPEEEALTEALLRMAPPACAEEDSAVDKALKRRFKVKWPLAS